MASKQDEYKQAIKDFFLIFGIELQEQSGVPIMRLCVGGMKYLYDDTTISLPKGLSNPPYAVLRRLYDLINDEAS